MVGLQYFATFLHVAKLPGVAQLSAARRGDLGPGLDIMGTRHRMIPAPSLQLQNTQLHIRNIAKYCQRFWHKPLKRSWCLSILSFDGAFVRMFESTDDIVSCGRLMRLGNEPSGAETITSLPSPGSVFCCFPEQRTGAFVIKPPPTFQAASSAVTECCVIYMWLDFMLRR